MLDGFRNTPVIIEPPFTIEFDIQRTVQSTINVVNLRIYNLSQNTREILRKDGFDSHDIRSLIFQVGYGEKLHTVAAGNIRSASSVRQGSDYITTIAAQDGGQAFNTARTNATYAKGTQQLTVVEKLIRELKPLGIERGTIGNIEGEFKRGASFSGNTVQLLDELTDGRFYIDNGRAYVIAENEVIDSSVLVINAASGLVGTPTREQAYTQVTTLFTPEIQLNQRVSLESSEKSFTVNNAKVYAIGHSGVISEAVGGRATTKLTLLSGEYLTVRRLEGGS